MLLQFLLTPHQGSGARVRGARRHTDKELRSIPTAPWDRGPPGRTCIPSECREPNIAEDGVEDVVEDGIFMMLFVKILPVICQ